MKIRLCVFVIFGCVCSVFSDNHQWDLAVSLSSQVELLSQNGALQGLTSEMYRSIKSITYDKVRHQFVVSQSSGSNSHDSIFSIRLPKDASAMPVVRNMPDNIQGLAIDLIMDVLYWTDSNKNRILRMSLNETNPGIETLFQFDNERPTGIAIDSCRRKLYWTNTNYNKPTIERSNLDGTSREVLVSTNMNKPQDVAVDHFTKKIYWTDQGEGIYYRIESANFDGSDRKIIIYARHQDPHSIAITKDMIFWTDLSSDILWGIKKNEGENPIKIRSFNYDKPMGLYAKNDLSEVAECQNVVTEINKNKDVGDKFVAAQDSTRCLFGSLVDQKCHCQLGYAGTHCEINLCLNYCFNGHCSISENGYPQCICEENYSGQRCETDMCKNYCVNDGTCKVVTNNGTKTASCECPQGFEGERCEKLQESNICTMLCEEGEEYNVLDKDGTKCRCANSVDTYSIVPKTNATSDILLGTNSFSSDLREKLKDPSFLISWTLTMVMFWVVVVMCFMLYKQRYMRPRIKKRIIVNKNITPLTYRPGQSTEQCEITIENCCNMNICETPCFEPPPPQFQCRKSDEKKTLLTNMENGGDIY